jgi:hypothetical protein
MHLISWKLSRGSETMSNNRTSELVINVINAHLPKEEACEENSSDHRKLKKWWQSFSK